MVAFALEREGETAPFIGEALRRHMDGQTETPMVPIPQSEWGREPHDLVRAVGSKGRQGCHRRPSRDARGQAVVRVKAIAAAVAQTRRDDVGGKSLSRHLRGEGEVAPFLESHSLMKCIADGGLRSNTGYI